MQPDSRPTPPPASWATFLGAFVLGVVVGAVGTVMHRWERPWGIAVCFVLVLAAALVARAWGGRRAWTGYAIALTATAWALSTEGPGGDVLVPAHQPIGWVWLIGAPVVAVVVALLPAAVFDDRPRPPRGSPAPVALDEASAAPGWPPPPGPVDAGWPPAAPSSDPAPPSDPGPAAGAPPGGGTGA